MNIYAFAATPEDIIRPELLNDKIDRMCREAMQEIAEMADTARDICCPETKKQRQDDAMRQLMAKVDAKYLEQRRIYNQRAQAASPYLRENIQLAKAEMLIPVRMGSQFAPGGLWQTLFG